MINSQAMNNSSKKESRGEIVNAILFNINMLISIRVYNNLQHTVFKIILLIRKK